MLPQCLDGGGEVDVFGGHLAAGGMGVERDIHSIPAIEYLGVMIALLGLEGKPYDKCDGSPKTHETK